MKALILGFLGMAGILVSFVPEGDTLRPERQWGQYRGYLAGGILDNANLPDSFNVADGKNVKWKIAVPGLGISCPVIWGNSLFLTTAISSKDTSGFQIGIYGNVAPVADSSVHEWKVYCYDKSSGSLIWEKTACTGIPKIKRHPKSTHANTSIATDGKHIVAFFGSEGLYCYDMQGDLKWKTDFGILKSVFYRMEQAEWEFASSPVLYQGVVIVQCDVLNNSFVAALDAETGKELWRAKRDELPGWCTPNIYLDNGKARVVVNGYKHRGAYDLKTGEEIWKMSGGGDIPIPTPVIGDSLIYMNSAHGPIYPIMAIRKGARGDITLKDQQTSGEFVSWYIPKGGSYMATMLLYDKYLYNCNWNGSVLCYEAATGKEVYKEKLGKNKSFTGSPVASDGKIYIADEEGNVYVFMAGPEFRLLSVNPLGDICMTTPAITDNLIYFRTMKYLYAIGK
jgi:outer membrane protein assembly factor BamB